MLSLPLDLRGRRRPLLLFRKTSRIAYKTGGSQASLSLRGRDTFGRQGRGKASRSLNFGMMIDLSVLPRHTKVIARCC
ncbi:hypothetical protein SOVF_194220 [Spinacia oleracea]|nr:hypothetical protein SOVF_194220 [Spinacia oleracea]